MEFESAGRLLGACAVIGAVLYGLRFVVRAMGRTAAHAGPGSRIVGVLETTALPNAASLHVVRVAERYYLVGRGAAGLANLCEIAPESIAATYRAAERPAHRARPISRWVARLRASSTFGR